MKAYEEKKGICRECGAIIINSRPYNQCYEYLGSYPVNEKDHPVICITCFENNEDVKFIKDVTRRAKISRTINLPKNKKNKYIEEILNSIKKSDIDNK